MNDIKITMLGTTSAGKTCYMIAMYAKMSEGVKGFTLGTTDPDKDIHLSDMWEKLESETGDSRWPRPTGEESQSYQFDFSYGFKRLMRFDWLDYRGGALRDDSSKKDVQDLTEQLLKSSCVFLCVSGEFLKEGANPQVVKKARIDRMNNPFMQKLTDSGRVVPVVIVITKYDLCSHRSKEQVLKDIRQLFNPLFAKGEGWPVMICPVTLGEGLANDINSGLINPHQVHLPLIFAIYSEYLQNTLNKQNEVETVYQTTQDLEQELQEARSRGWLTILIDDFKGRDPVGNVRGKLKQANQKLAQHSAEFEKLATRLHLLMQELDTEAVSIYLDGEELRMEK